MLEQVETCLCAAEVEENCVTSAKHDVSDSTAGNHEVSFFVAGYKLEKTTAETVLGCHGIYVFLRK